MICEQMFLLKKNGEPRKRRCYCRHPELIENYEKAIADTTQIWECHHRFEAIFTKEELIKYNWYFDVEPNCLIFLTKTEHRKIDSRCKRVGEANKRRPAHNRRKVKCVETGEIFDSAKEASMKTGTSQSGISLACNGSRKSAGGYHWKYV